MTHIIRTTISLPEEVYTQLKIRAIKEKKTLSELVTYIVKYIPPVSSPLQKKTDPMLLLGQLKVGITTLYTNRDELYETKT